VASFGKSESSQNMVTSRGMDLSPTVKLHKQDSRPDDRQNSSPENMQEYYDKECEVCGRRFHVAKSVVVDVPVLNSRSESQIIPGRTHLKDAVKTCGRICEKIRIGDIKIVSHVNLALSGI
jgi:hypothetical protein